MLTLFTLLSTIAPSPAAAALPEARVFALEAAPIRLWMNSDRRYRPGDRVRLQVDADANGYLLVLNYDTEGRVRVLFPLDPRDDAQVHAGRRYEVRDGNAEEAFRAYGDGTGLIFTALAQEPWRFEEVVLADRWDYTRLEIDPRSTNPEGDLANLVQSIAGPSGFDYDVIGYRVYGEDTYSHTNVYSTVYLHDRYLNCYAYSTWFHNSCRGWPYGGWAVGFGYSRYSYGYGYYPYGYGYNPFGFGGYYPNYPGRPGGVNRGPILVGRPRSYTVRPRPTLGGATFGGVAPSSRNSGRDVIPAIDWRARSRARPVSGSARPVSGSARPVSGSARPVRGSARPVSGSVGRGAESVIRSGSNRGSGNSVAPPARRTRPEGATYPAARGSRDLSDRGRQAAPSARSRDDRGSSSRAQPARRDPPARSEPSRRDPPPARAQPSRSGGSGGGGHAPPPSPPPSRPRRP